MTFDNRKRIDWPEALDLFAQHQRAERRSPATIVSYACVLRALRAHLERRRVALRPGDAALMLKWPPNYRAVFTFSKGRETCHKVQGGELEQCSRQLRHG